jgi:hypothetical protein
MNLEYDPQSHTINQHFYLQVPRHLRDSVHCKQLQKWESGKWHIHHDNALVHTAQLMQQFFSRTQYSARKTADSLSTCQMCLPMTSFCSLTLKKSRKARDLMMWKQLKTMLLSSCW